MFVSKFNDSEYRFNEDHVVIDGREYSYSLMTDIAHKAGETPAVVFTYDGERVTMPYNKEEYKAILPFFIQANKLNPEEEAAEAAIVEHEAQETEAPAEEEPDFSYDPEEETAVESEVPAEAEPDFSYDLEEETAVEPEVPAEAGPDFSYDPEEETAVEPEVPAAAEAPVEPKAPDGSSAVADKVGNLPMRKILIAAAIIAALIIAIVAIVMASGKSVDGLNSRVKVETLKTESGDEYKVAVIEDDASVDAYAVDYFKSCFKEDDKVQWVYNKKTKQTVMFADHDDTVLVCVYDHVDGEEEDPTLLGSGKLRETYLIYPQTDEIVQL